MDWNNPRSVEALIKRLSSEITEIDEAFYNFNDTKDRVLYAGMLERKRDDVVRATVLQLHTAIEDLLDTLIICRVLNVKAEERTDKLNTKSGHALHDLLKGDRSIGFYNKLQLATALRLVNKPLHDKLVKLNQLRNKCSHNWLLKVMVRRNIKPKNKKKPLLNYKGRDLHNIKVLKEFYSDYGVIYVRLFLKT